MSTKKPSLKYLPNREKKKTKKDIAALEDRLKMFKLEIRTNKNRSRRMKKDSKRTKI